jgi:hypothetical protein
MPRTLILEPTRELAAQVEKASSSTASSTSSDGAADRRGVIRRPGREDHPRRRRADRHPGPAARSLRTRQAAAHGYRDTRHRRSRPHARHGLHPGYRAHLQAGALHAPDAVLLGDDAARDHAPHRAVPQNPVRVEVSRVATQPPRSPSVRRLPRRRAKRAPPCASCCGREDFKNAIIFCNRKRDVDIVTSRSRNTASAGALHGDMDQSARMDAGRLQARRRRAARLLRCGRARPRHSRREPRLQLRCADPRR